ncbi:MAG: hypothetical protein Q9220_004944 [cf. Caloplaca sp. 1 TL-2023]
MNGEPTYPSEEQDLRSWHPAHMPEYTSAFGAEVKSLKNATESQDELLLNGETSALPSPGYEQSKDGRSDCTEEEAPLEYRRHTPLTSSLPRRFNATRSDNGINDEVDQESTWAFQDHEEEVVRHKGESEVVNGISNVGHAPQLQSILDSSRPTGVQGLEETSHGVMDLSRNFGPQNRTNSFPNVPPLHQSQRTQGQNQSQSQVESILEEDEYAGISRQDDALAQENEDFFGGFANNDHDDFLSQSIGMQRGDHSSSPADDEARFEEGLPLVQPEQSFDEESTPVNADELTDLHSGGGVNPDQDFFGHDTESHQDASFFKPKPLDRKTTSHVLDTLSYPPHNATHGEPYSLRREQALKKDPIDGVDEQGSSSTDLESVKELQPDSSQNADQKDDDLAALWQAALDDDDLLDDGEVAAAQLDPSAETTSSVNPRNLRSLDVQLPQDLDTSTNGAYRNVETRSSSASSQSRYTPNATHQSTAAFSQPKQSSSYTLSHSSSAPAGFGHPNVQPTPQNDTFARTSRPGMPKPAQSFADKSKGGYTSPYDLPMDVSRPKKRTNLQQVQNVSTSQLSSQPPPPPRSTSMYAISPSDHETSPPLPPVPSATGTTPNSLSSRPTSSNVKAKPSVGNFFEELPATKSRPSSSSGRYVGMASQQSFSQMPHHPTSSTQPPIAQQAPLTTASMTPSYQLVPPERHSPYANLNEPANISNSQLPPTTRYSPAPGLQSNVPPPRNRYAASPGGVARPPAGVQAMPFQPRTSSPLAQNHARSQQPHHQNPTPREVVDQPPIPHTNSAIRQSVASGRSPASNHLKETFNPVVGRNVPEAAITDHPYDARHIHDSLLPRSTSSFDQLRSSPSDSGISALTPESEVTPNSPELHSQYPVAAQRQTQTLTSDMHIGLPQRSQTQSPGAARPKPEAFSRIQDVYQRPASANGGPSLDHVEPPVSSSHAAANRPQDGQRHDVLYIRPVDGHEHDPLERWKGAPIFTFGFGGTTVTSFPKHVPRYAAGHGFPMIKCTPGELKLQLGNRGTLDDENAKFPGPLKSKGKKKELLEWLQRKVDGLESRHTSIPPSPSLPDPLKRHEEKILLWKIMRILVEFDGTISGNKPAEYAVRAALYPGLMESETVDSPVAVSSSISKAPGTHPLVNPVETGPLETVRKLLLQGEREKAAWHAVDQRMWAHAMILASTLDKTVWKQVLHEFTRLEVKSSGENTESIAALYEVFAGNWDESIDELVPPSARAGLQMVSKAASTGPARNALDGLDKWRETLVLVLSNRTPNDENALGALGRLLAGYGRVEAAHLCLIFAKSNDLFGATEGDQASIALFGADHHAQPFDYGRDLDGILLTEVYEFARSTLAPSPNLSISPHLQSYKLYHAMLLAEHGHRSEAQQYCDAIMNTLKSTTKPSPYYHGLLFNTLDDLVERLQQAPRDGSSWMSKPMDKVSGSMWKRFNNFIVGDESDTASLASGKGDQEAGPFANVAADASSMSRAGSSGDLYSAYTSHTVPTLPAATAMASRYAPGGPYPSSSQYTPRSSLEQQNRSPEDFAKPGLPRNVPSPQSQHPHPSAVSKYPSSPGFQQDPSGQQYQSAQPYSSHYSPKADTYLPTPRSQPDYMPTISSETPYQSPASPNTTLDSHSPQPSSNINAADNGPYEPSTLSNGTYAPSYEPPSTYTPYDAEGQDDSSSPDRKSPKKKKSFMDNDDDDDFTHRAAAILKNDKARKDRDADEAFRKAAEADAQKDQPKDLKAKKSWFGGVGGWLGSGGKKDDDLNTAAEPKAIKAKLGEESSFYYDKELKKWVNKKGPAPSANSETPKPPPPKGPPSRAVSGAGGPPPVSSSTPPVPNIPASMLLSSAGQRGTPPVASYQSSEAASGNGTPVQTASPVVPPPPPSAPGSGEPVAAAPAPPPSAPPSRATTTAGAGGGLDDLIGEPQARKGGTLRKGKKGRGYVDIMAK